MYPLISLLLTTNVQVGVGIANDAVKLFKDYNVSIKGVEDLSFHANQKLGGDPQKWSLASLTEILVSKQVFLNLEVHLFHKHARLPV